MNAGAQFECFGAALRAPRWRTLLLSALIALAAAPIRAQQPSIIVGNIEGDDVTVSSGRSDVNLSPSSGTAAVANGGIVAVKSGQARLMLVSGGEIDICGPAKFTVLQSGDSITLALDFGRIRVQVPTSTDLRVFTPTMLAIPLTINDAPRDVTVTLETDDSLCVRAGSGALLLQSQFSNQKIVVPQAGQFFFAQGNLVPVVRADMQCECVLKEARGVPSSQPWPSVGLTAPPEVAAAPKPAADAKPKADDRPAPPDVEYSILARPNEAHPVSPEPNAVPLPPPDSMPVYQIVMPPLTFSAASPAPPPLPAADMIMLIRTAQVDPDFEFAGHVDPPVPEEQTKHLDEKKKAHGSQPRLEGAKPGFWAKMKHFFLGSSS
jgi:hypothetical protein